jgi:7,8-dihydropterin-6-yl-methyl-4-(beta-D-ribofuranosyl)aminobenzene 5'-phosphate synthase
MRIVFLSENKTDRPPYMGEHGLSIYIETGENKLLFDGGASHLFLDHAKEKGIDLSKVDNCIVSHGHYDHTGGFPDFIKINSTAPIHLHPASFNEVYGEEKGIMDEEPCSILWTQDQRKLLEPRLSLSKDPVFISEDIVISGEIPEEFGNQSVEDFHIKNQDGTYILDTMDHEQFLMVRESRKLYLFFGCSHKGVFPALRYARTFFPYEEIELLVAGMHLYNADLEQVDSIMEELQTFNIQKLMPVHCTGIHAIARMKEMDHERVVIATVGDEYEF